MKILNIKNIQSNIKERPLGEAFLCLRGAIENLKDVIELNNINLVLKRRADLLQEVRIFEVALKNNRIKSIISQHYRVQGKIEIMHAFSLLQHASKLLLSNMRLLLNENLTK